MNNAKHLIFLRMQSSNHSIYQQLINICENPKYYPAQIDGVTLLNLENNQIIYA